MSEPRFKHDGCGHCRFIGPFGDEDVWFCDGPLGPTIIRRSSDEPSDYRSMSPAMAKSLNYRDWRSRSGPELCEFVDQWRGVLALIEQGTTA